MRRGQTVLVGLLVGVTSAGSIHCGRCRAPLVVVDELVADEMLALPEIAKLEDSAPPKREANGCEYGDERHWAKLGPLNARYTAWDYKGQTVTTGVGLYLSSPTCQVTEVSFTMMSRGDVRLRHDVKRNVYIVTNHAEKKGAVVVRMSNE